MRSWPSIRRRPSGEAWYASSCPKAPALATVVVRAFDAVASRFTRDLGARVIRKHLGWYLEAAGVAAGLRREILTAPPEKVPHLLHPAFVTYAEAA